MDASQDPLRSAARADVARSMETDASGPLKRGTRHHVRIVGLAIFFLAIVLWSGYSCLKTTTATRAPSPPRTELVAGTPPREGGANAPSSAAIQTTPSGVNSAAGVHLQGIVRAGGAPVPRVFITGRTPGGEMRGVTRADGTFTLDLPRGGPLSFTVTGLTVSSISPTYVDGDTSDVVVSVTGGCTLAGRVLLMGSPVAGAELEVGLGGRKTVSDATGRFAFTDLPAGVAEVTAKDPGSDANSSVVRVPLAPGESRTEVDIEVDHGGSISGVVVNEGGAPISQVGVSWYCAKTKAYEQTLTDDKGNYTVRHLTPGDYVATVTSRGFEYRPASAIGFPVVSVREAVSHVEGVTLQASTATADIGGIVVDEAGVPVADEVVLILVPNKPAWMVDGEMSSIQKTKTDGHGRFTFSELPKGRFDIGVGPRGDRAVLAGIETGRTDLVFTVHATMDVRVSLEGFPPGPVSLRARVKGNDPLAFRRDVTVADTESLISNVPVGPILFVATSGPYVAAELVEISLSGEQSVRLRAHALGSLTGNVSVDHAVGQVHCIGAAKIAGLGSVDFYALPVGQLELFSTGADGIFRTDVPTGFPLEIKCNDGYRRGTLLLPPIGPEGASGQRIVLDSMLD